MGPDFRQDDAAIWNEGGERGKGTVTVTVPFPLVATTIYPPAILPPGKYTLILVGINWGGPQEFIVKQYAGGPPIFHQLSPAANGPVGDNWHVAVPMTI